MKSPRKANYIEEKEWRKAYDLYEKVYLVSYDQIVISSICTLKDSEIVLTGAFLYLEMLSFFETKDRLDDIITDVPQISDYYESLKEQLYSSFALMIPVFERNRMVFKY